MAWYTWRLISFSGTCLMGAPSVSCLVVPVQAGTDPLQLVRILVVVDVARKLALHAAAKVQPRLLLQVVPG